MDQSVAERRALGWIVGVGGLVVVFRVVLIFVSSRSGALPPVLSIWAGSGNVIGCAAAILALDALLVLISRRPGPARAARVLLHGLFGLMVVCALIGGFVWLAIGDIGNGRDVIEVITGLFGLVTALGLMSAVQWFSLQAVVERVKGGGLRGTE